MSDGSLFQFKADLAKFAKQIDADVAKVTKAITFQLMERIVSRTPVDTGRARASWNVNVEAPDFTPAPEGERSAQGAADEAMATLNRLANIGAYRVIYLSNGLPYIRALEYGHSKQAPLGFVRIALSEVEAGLLAKGGGNGV